MIITIIGMILFIIIISVCCCSDSNISNSGTVPKRTASTNNVGYSDHSKKRSELIRGRYCNSDCIHWYEEFVDDEGALVAEVTGNVFYRCDLGHSTEGFCEDYE